MLKWPKTYPVTAIDLDSHLYIPIIDIDASRNSDCDGDYDTGMERDDKCHLYYRTNQAVDNATNVTGVSTVDYHQYYDIVSSGDYVTLDKDDSSSTAPPGDETMTITKVRSGTYSYSVHNNTDRDNGTTNYKTNFSRSRAKVKVIYNDGGNIVRKRFYVPNDNGTLWKVFTFDSNGSGSGFTRVQTMTYVEDPGDIY